VYHLQVGSRSGWLVGDHEDQDLETEIEAQWGERNLLVNFVWHVIEHEIHHRGELYIILGLLGREGLDA
jgi:uncharacterized damage-inducible protein DinB